MRPSVQGHRAPRAEVAENVKLLRLHLPLRGYHAPPAPSTSQMIASGTLLMKAFLDRQAERMMSTPEPEPSSLSSWLPLP